MRMPERPPSINSLWAEIFNGERYRDVISIAARAVNDDKYHHWDKLRRLVPPKPLTHREWWFVLKNRRTSNAKFIPLTDKAGNGFSFTLADPIPERLHNIDLGVGGFIQMPEQITNPETRDQYYVGSLIEEAITSSQLEGATTTRPVAKEMIRSGRKPRDESEQMILNNYLTMQRIGSLKNEPLSKEIVFEIHRLVTDKTLKDPTAAGRFRNDIERVVVGDNYGEVCHEPPPASQLDARMQAMCDFANGISQTGFIHPALRSIILHFWLAYDHPFVDGNGRTARALFYWSMLHGGFWLCEFISISHIIRKAPTKYGRAFLLTETDENDLTYFLLYHLEVVRQAVVGLHDYIRRKSEELTKTEARMRGLTVLNHRQRALISHALRHPNQQYTIGGHEMSHKVVYQTARTDLIDLCERGVFKMIKVGKKGVFIPVTDLEKKLEGLAASVIDQ